MSKKELNPGQRKLKKARTEIEAILKKYDIAGYVSLHAPDAGEIFWNIWPSYSILIGDIPAVRIKSKLTEYGGDKTKQLRNQALTAQMMRGLSLHMAGHAMAFLELSQTLDGLTKAEHAPEEYTPDPSKLNPGIH